MRPTDRPTTPFWARIERWIEETVAADPLGRKITQGALAAAFGVSDSAISNWKLGHDVPTMNNLLVVAKKTGLPFEELARLVQETVAARSDLAEAARRVALRAEQDNSTIFADIEVEEGPDEPAAAVVDRYLVRERGDVAAAASLLAHEGAEGAGVDEFTFVAALRELNARSEYADAAREGLPGQGKSAKARAAQDEAGTGSQDRGGMDPA